MIGNSAKKGLLSLTFITASVNSMDQQPKDFFYEIRPTVRAVIFREGKLLVQIKEKPGQPLYLTLPGGKQEPGETAVQALERECMEEVGAKISVGALLHVAEVFKPKINGTRHQIELLFACDVEADYVAQMGSHPDPSQTGTIWACPIDRATEFLPGYARLLGAASPLYLGVLDG